jgi:bifunctional DNA-binding transcriptional regulator/antitoxin component of YhaV-PrlF toxin-antitoxin module
MLYSSGKGAMMPTEFHLMMQQRGVLTLPAELRKRHHLDEAGAQMRVVERDDGVIELHPQLPVPADQVWFWSQRWQRMEGEADADIADGRVAVFEDVDSFLADLDA